MKRPKGTRTPSERRRPPTRSTASSKDPFVGARPIVWDQFIGGLPDERSAEAIIADLRNRYRRRASR